MLRLHATVPGAVLALYAVAQGWPAHAQTPPAPQPPPTAKADLALPSISVTASPAELFPPAAPFDVQQHPAGQTITTVGEERIKDVPAFSIGDVLRDVPGISVKQGNGPRDVGISIRGSNARNGFGIRNIQVFEDGFPITQPDGLSRTDLTDPHAYGSIDVFRGPSSAMFGNYATGGAINFHTRAGGDIGGVGLGSDFGSFNYFNEYAILGDKSGPFEYAAFLSHVRSDGFQRQSSFNTSTGNVLASYTPTPDDKITVKVIDNYLATALPIRLSLNQFLTNPFQRGCTTVTAAAGCAAVNLVANGVSGATVAQTADQAGLGRHDQRTILGTRWEHSLDNDTMLRTTFVYDNKDINQPTGATSAQFDQPAYNFMSDITGRGRVFGLDETHFAQFFLNYTHLGSDTFNVAPGGNARLGALTSYYVGHQENTGARAREEVKLSPTLAAAVGLGFEYTQLQALNTIYAYPAAGRTSSFLPVSREFFNVAPEASLTYTPSDQWRFQGRVATGYGTPQVGNLFVTPQGVAGNNTQLTTQSNVGIDLGTEWKPVESVRLNLTGFYEFFRNELVTQSAGAGLQNFTFNAPKSEHRGIELGADWRPFDGARLTLAYLYDNQVYTRYVERLSVGAGAAARTAALDRSGNKIPGVEPNNLFTRISYDHPSGPYAGLGGFVEAYFRDSYFIDNANLLKIPSYAIVNLNLHYDLGLERGIKGVRLFFEIQNLLDKTYVASANNISDSLNGTTGLQNPGSVLAATGTGSIYAGAPRTFIGGVKVKF